jgi:hypothetical protein
LLLEKVDIVIDAVELGVDQVTRANRFLYDVLLLFLDLNQFKLQLRYAYLFL